MRGFSCLQGLIHISELSWNRVFTPEAVVKVGDFVRCKVLSINKEKGHINLSLKVSILHHTNDADYILYKEV